MSERCAECGMECAPAEYHPYAACLMFKACRDAVVVRANLPTYELAQLRAELATMRESRDAAVRLWNDCGEELATTQADRDNLLARIHRDGGHYLAEHGAAKAVADADAIVAATFAKRDALQAAIDELCAINALWTQHAQASTTSEIARARNALRKREPLAWAAARVLATPANPKDGAPGERT